jgi:hypothetical protein
VGFARFVTACAPGEDKLLDRIKQTPANQWLKLTEAAIPVFRTAALAAWGRERGQGKSLLSGACRDARFVWGPSELKDEAVNRARSRTVPGAGLIKETRRCCFSFWQLRSR